MPPVNDEPTRQRTWRTIDEYTNSPEFRERLAAEFPESFVDCPDGLSRRHFLMLLSASAATGGLAGCTRHRPDEKIVPYVKQPEILIQGKPLYFATAFPFAGYGIPVLVESYMGRPIKIEGNPEHPASMGASDPFAQASIMGLYDPDRSRTVLKRGKISSWTSLLGELRATFEAQRGNKGAGLRILTERVTSPTLAAMLGQLLTQLPEAKWHVYEPCSSDGARLGAQMAFGTDVDAHYRFTDADVILVLDSDFLHCGPASLRYSREFADRRRVWQGEADPPRLYAIESRYTLTGGAVDSSSHRIPAPTWKLDQIARAVARAVGVEAAGEIAQLVVQPYEAWINAVAADLKAASGRSLVIAGDEQPSVIHALAHAMNSALGNYGKTVVYTDPIESVPGSSIDSLRELCSDLEHDRVEMLLVVGGNPIYTAPGDLMLDELFARAPYRLHLGQHYDETAELCHWHIPETHYLEAWGDIRAHDGIVTVQQPLIEPLYAGKSALNVLASLLGQTDHTPFDIIHDHWKAAMPQADFEQFWRKALHDGMLPGTAAPERQVTFTGGNAIASAPRPQPAALEVLFRPDPTIYDGRFCNNPWLQELPKQITKATWDNPVQISPAMSQKLGIHDGDEIEIRVGDRSVETPAIVVPGHSPGVITVFLGHGRSRAGQIGNGVGFDANFLRRSNALWSASDIEIRKTGKQSRLAVTQGHFTMDNRDLVRIGTVEEFRKNPNFAHEHHHGGKEDTSIYPQYPYEGYKWAMAIDTSVCTGCSGCVVACMAENNIPVVGKNQVLRSREMHWLRVDTYFVGDADNPRAFHQPLPCMHCEAAPCEPVCPVVATAHSSEGLNDMIYNRCVGTRFCQNNCPYKVRRFNFHKYADWKTPQRKLLYNPEVTVRERGVMEKCTYCIQRIAAARITSENEQRKVRDGEILTACQAACPTGAIVFGDINDPESAVAKIKKSPLNYGLLTELNTRPRTSYLAAVRNPNRTLAGAEKPTGEGGHHA